ncbi:hypothetical protein ACFOZ0_00780 [Streptomyces yaanensis]|uniref:Tetratricopeptide repeat protein n=1 Tax=Streptomyces yaanensis TaxID=1142239 RepID=A0ABV7S7X1_9ACTN|nr:hypothetical protein [Streptomyces sp. CGMCC 4.7035]WNB99457.1 hypothetical protein Q2K21_16005 [Streptomyces sp. CGMCC 4.7035]
MPHPRRRRPGRRSPCHVDDYFARHGGSPHERVLARADVLKRCGHAEKAETELAPFATPVEALAHNGTVSGAVAVAERLVRQGEPEKAATCLRERLDRAKVTLSREDLV